MSKHLPKSTLSTLDDIQRETAAASGAPAAVAENRTTPTAPPLPAPAPLRQAASRLRRAQADNIVERYTTYSALGGGIPLVVVDTLSVSLIIFNMTRALAEHYRAPFADDRVKAAVAALIGGIAAPGLGNLAAHLLTRIVPGAWLIGAAASSATAAALTRYTGQEFIAHFEAGGTTLDFDFDKLQPHASRVRLAAK